MTLLPLGSDGVWDLVLTCGREFGDCVGEGLDLRGHGVELARFVHCVGGLLLCGDC
jgi:hypothetical protein